MKRLLCNGFLGCNQHWRNDPSIIEESIDDPWIEELMMMERWINQKLLN